MAQEPWHTIQLVCGALLALGTVVGLTWRKVVRPLWTAFWRTVRRFNEVADDLLGDEAKDIPSMTKRMSDLDEKIADLKAEFVAAQDQHMRVWHAPQSNGSRSRARRE